MKLLVNLLHTNAEIKAQYPKHRNVEKSLQKLRGMNICVWMIGYGGVWKPASDFFYVRK